MKVYNAELDDVHTGDAPDFSDAYVSYAEHEDGTPFTDDELDDLNDNYREIVYELVLNYVY